jgi:hypothetical protein
MDNRERFETFLMYLNALVVGWILAMLLLAMTGCTTTEKPNRLFIQKVCPDTEILVFTNAEWSKMDQWNYDVAINRCSQLYPRSPCLKKFIRYDEGRYGAICSATPRGELNWLVAP